MIKVDNLPAALRETGLFCCWRYEERDGKKTKVPYNPRTGGRAQSTSPATFAPLPAALDALEQGGYDGIGVGIFGGLGAIDIDHCVSDTGELSATAADIMETMQAYTEYSPSGKGLRMLFTVPEGFQYDKARFYINNQREGLEIYIAGATSKYVTITGNTLTPGMELAERGEQLRRVLEKYMIRQTPAPLPLPMERRDTAGAAADPDDAALIERARRSKNGAAFSALWAGDTAGYKSASEADLALCNMLAFWTGKDAGKMDRLFRQSGLMREKWTRSQSSSTYGALTIQNAINSTRQTYDPQRAAEGGYALGWDGTPEGESPAAYRSEPTASGAVNVSDSWDPAIPFESVNTPDFPVEALPRPLDSFVACLAESTQTPEEMAGILSLGVLSTAFQARYVAVVTPDWKERLCLYTAAIAPPGERKSSVISALMEPVYGYESMRREAGAVEIAQNRAERAMLEKMLQAAQSAVKKGGDDFKRHEALDLAAQLAEFKDKHPFRLIVDDTTPEKLIDLMEQQNGSITIASAEGGVFDTMRGRYDKAANFDIYLKAHNGDTITVDRIGRASNHIEDPRLTMILAIQPEVLQGLMDDPTLRGRGFCGRFLYAVCRSKVGHREISPPPVPPTVREEYRQFVRRILSHQGGGVIRLSPEADKIREAFQALIELKLDNEWDHMRDWGGKLTGAAVRIAALFHAATARGEPAETLISPEWMAAAVKLSEFFSAHAEAAYQMMGADNGEDSAKYLLKRIERIGQREITRRDLFSKCQSKFKRVENWIPPCKSCRSGVMSGSLSGRPAGVAAKYLLSIR